MSNLLVYATMMSAWVFFFIYWLKGEGRIRRIVSCWLAIACAVTALAMCVMALLHGIAP